MFRSQSICTVTVHILPVKISRVNSPYTFDLNVKISTVDLCRLDRTIVTADLFVISYTIDL